MCFHPIVRQYNNTHFNKNDNRDDDNNVSIIIIASFINNKCNILTVNNSNNNTFYLKVSFSTLKDSVQTCSYM